jgi:hypothetical protein
VINGKIYIAGGSDTTGGLTNGIVFDPGRNTWSPIAPMLNPQNGATVVLGGKLYVTGSASNPAQDEQMYDPVLDKWTRLTTLPTDRHDLGAAADETTHRIFAVGGYNGSTSSALEVFTAPGEATWSSSTPAIATVNSNGVAGGLSQGSILIQASSAGISGSTVLTVVVPPGITAEPLNATASPGGTATFSVAGTGGGLSYQWYFNGIPISNATNSALVLGNVTAAYAGNYTVVVSNAAGTVTSSSAALSLMSLNRYAGLTINGKVSGTYKVEYATNLSNPVWTTLTNLVLPSSPYLYIDTTTPATSGVRFYRASLQ